MIGRKRLFGSVSARLVALFFIAQVLATAGILGFARQAIVQISVRDQQAFVAELRDDLATAHRHGGNPAVAREIAERLESRRGENLVLFLVGADGQRLAGNITAWPAGLSRTAGWHELTLALAENAVPQTMGVMAMRLPGGSLLLVGRAIDTDLQGARVSARGLLIAFVLALPVLLFVAAATTRLIDARIARIAGTALAVGDGDLGSRVALDGSDDGFDRLGQSVNRMLARIETLVGELRIVTSALAHDLRAPISRLTTTLETALAATDDPVALAALERVAIEAAQLQQMLATALQISEAEAGIGRDCLAAADIAEFIGDIAELYEPAAEAHGIALEAGAMATGSFPLHRTLVAQAVGNLIDNAMKYAGGADRITLSATLEAGKLLITVADNGIGIAPADRALARRRFGRLDASRQHSGAGLGLALVEAVARLHHGELQLADNAPGLKAVLLLGPPG